MRILGSLVNGRARRNLFGPVDRDQLRVEYQAALRKDLEEASTRWGFDFIADKPMKNSDFQWEVVPGTKVPLVYRSCMLDPQQPGKAAEATLKPKRSRVSASHNEKENIPCSPKRCPMNMESLEKTPGKRASTGLKRKQTNITGTDRRCVTRAHSCSYAWAKLPPLSWQISTRLRDEWLGCPSNPASDFSWRLIQKCWCPERTTGAAKLSGLQCCVRTHAFIPGTRAEGTSATHHYLQVN